MPRTAPGVMVSAVMQIRPASPEDATRLTEIAFAAKRHWGYPERWLESWREVLTVKPEFIAGHETFSAVVDGQQVGFYALAQKDAQLDLLHIWVLPDWMGRGIGRALFCHAVERAKALGFRQLQIESDPNAEGFYQRLGARRVGTAIHTVEQQRRELPVLVYEIDAAFDDGFGDGFYFDPLRKPEEGAVFYSFAEDDQPGKPATPLLEDFLKD